MEKEIVIYILALTSLFVFMLLGNTNMKLRNKVLVALVAPFVGGLFILLGSIFILFVFSLLVFGGLLYLFNKRRFEGWLAKQPRYGVYRYCFLF